MKYNINDAEAVEIRKKLEYLNSVYDGRRDFKLFDVISIEDVRKFEEENKVKLPDDYVWFITNVGNGGEWYNGYNFWKLDETDFSYEELPDYKKGQENFSLDVLSLGCSYSFGIILKGEHFGKISSNADYFAGYEELPVKNFKELYLKWLNEDCMRYDMFNFEGRVSGTIEENISQYKQSHNIGLLNSILSKINKKVVYDKLTEDLYQMFLNETEIKNKVLIAKSLIKSGYKDVISILDDLFIPENYYEIVRMLYVFVNYFGDTLHCDKIIKNADIYYPMLIKMLKSYDILGNNFERCFEMVVMNPLFNENDIADILESDDKKVIKCIAYEMYKKNIVAKIGKHIQIAKEKCKKYNE